VRTRQTRSRGAFRIRVTVKSLIVILLNSRSTAAGPETAAGGQRLPA
jgi:hypothetical protein